MINAPDSVKSLHWDTPWENLDEKLHARYIIERIAEYGDVDDLKWLFSVYSEEEIRETIKISKRLSVKTAYFFAKILDIPEKSILCIQQPYTQKQHRF